MILMRVLRNAGIAILVGLLLGMISLIIVAVKLLSNLSLSDLAKIEVGKEILSDFVPLPVQIIILIVGISITIFIYSGFISLGRRFDSNLLVIVSLVFMIGLIIYSLYSNISYIIQFYLNVQSNALAKLDPVALTINRFFVITLEILLGIALVKLKDQLELAKTAGILYIIAGATTLIIIGSLISVVAQIVAAIMFFKTSNKLEIND
nr:hypothetical protein [Candidatus Woesearchaeota archaeon]